MEIYKTSQTSLNNKKLFSNTNVPNWLSKKSFGHKRKNSQNFSNDKFQGQGLPNTTKRNSNSDEYNNAINHKTGKVVVFTIQSIIENANIE